MNEYYQEKRRKNDLQCALLYRLFVCLMAIVFFAVGMSFCAPAMIGEKEYQDKRFAESMKIEAKYRAMRSLRPEVQP